MYLPHWLPCLANKAGGCQHMQVPRFPTKYITVHVVLARIFLKLAPSCTVYAYDNTHTVVTTVIYLRHYSSLCDVYML